MKSCTQQLRESKSTTKLTTASKYVRGRQLGKGGFAKCYQFTQVATGRLMAGKVIEKASLTRAKAREKLVSEIEIHRSIRHPNIVCFDNSFQDAESYYIVMELCPNQTLNELVRRRKRLTQLEAQCFLFQLAGALDYLHKNRVIHRDLKLSNLFLSDKLEIKVGDLGLAAKLSSQHQRRRTMCGTPNYIAPEIIDGVGHSYQVDMWSYGVIAYALMVGRLPFQNKQNNPNITYNKIRMCNYAFPDQVQLSRAAKSFINKLIQIDPCKRMTFDEVFSHQFLTATPFPKTLPISSLAQPPPPHYLKQFVPVVGSQEQKPTTRESSRQLVSSHRNSSTDRNHYLQARVSAADIIGKTHKESLQQGLSKLPRPASTTLLSKWRNLVKDGGEEEKTKETQREKQKERLPIFPQKNKLENEIEQWVVNFVENPKYGACYSLNSGAVGMTFADNTCMISDAVHLRMKYFELGKGSSKQIKQGESKALIFDAGCHDHTLNKKAKVFEHFKNELIKQKHQTEKRMTTDQLIRVTKQRYRKETKQNSMNVYVKRFGCKNGFKYFLLSNNVLQGIFKDGSEILVARTNNLHINKYGEQKVFHSADEVTGETRKQFEFLLGMMKNSKAGGEILQKEITRESSRENLRDNIRENIREKSREKQSMRVMPRQPMTSRQRVREKTDTSSNKQNLRQNQNSSSNPNKSSSLIKNQLSTSTNDSKQNSLRPRKFSITLSRPKR